MEKKSLAILLAVTLCIMSGCGSPEEKMEAVSMRLQRTAGKVSLWDVKGQEQSLLEQMRLIVGNVLGTEKESLAQVSLDDSRMVTMEEKSKVSIDSAGKNQVITVKEGNAFFNISEKVKEGDSLKIRVGNIICGITGTSAQFGFDSEGKESVILTDGNLELEVNDENNSGQGQKTSIKAGEMVTLSKGGGSGTSSLEVGTFTEENLSPTSLYAIGQDSSLKDRITESTGFSGEKLEKLAELTSAEKNPGEEKLPLTGTQASLMTQAIQDAFKAANKEPALELAIITGVRGSLDAGVKAGYNDEALTKLTTTTSGVLNDLAANGLGKSINASDLVQVVDSASGSISGSVTAMAQSGMASTEVNNVVDAIGKAYDNVITTATGSNVNISMLTATTSGQISQTITSQISRNATGAQTAQAITGNATGVTAANTPAPAPQAPAPQAAPAPAPAEPVVEEVAPVYDDDDDDDDDDWYPSSTPSTPPSSSSQPASTGDTLPKTFTQDLLEKNIRGQNAVGSTEYYSAMAFNCDNDQDIARYAHLYAQCRGNAGGKYLSILKITADDATASNKIEVTYTDSNIKSTDQILIHTFKDGIWELGLTPVKSVQNGFFTFEITGTTWYFFVKNSSSQSAPKGDTLPKTFTQDLLEKNIRGQNAVGSTEYYSAMAFNCDNDQDIARYAHLYAQCRGNAGGKYLSILKITADDATASNKIEVTYTDSNIKSTDQILIHTFKDGIWELGLTPVKSVQNGFFTFEITGTTWYLFVKKLN